MNNNKKGFTFVELAVSIVIIGILSGIGIISYISYLGNARDTQRKSDIAQLSSALRLTKQEKGFLPDPGEKFDIVLNSNILALQGKMDNDVVISNIDRIPLDPKLKTPYIYSVTNNKQEYQLALTLENSDSPKALVEGTYKTVSINNLPSIVLAVNNNSLEQIDIISNANSFVLSDQEENLVYTFQAPFGAVTEAESIASLINDLKSKNLLFTRASYASCEEIKEAGKSLGVGTNEYQIFSGSLININCTF